MPEYSCGVIKLNIRQKQADFPDWILVYGPSKLKHNHRPLRDSQTTI